MNEQLIRKYNVPGPRYTSYPTVPYWDADTFSATAWRDSIRKSYDESRKDGISLYIHLPFCESMCTFCGCTKRITKNHDVEDPYIRSVLKEWRMYVEMLGEKPKIAELHLGGGTPTFFSSKNLEDLINGIFALGQRTATTELGFEGHPNNTTRQHLETLYKLGFRRVSFGVQDYSERVQRAINRLQPFEHVKEVTEAARSVGYTSIGQDLIYGLPFQTLDDVIDTISKTVALQPDRLAFYSYAHTPWLKGNGQRGFREEDLPRDAEKRMLYETGKRMLSDAGYHEIGMDHFALTTDSLFTATENGALHRNFMGYTTASTRMMIGLGVSAIGDSWYGFAQNTKNLEDYHQLIEWDTLPLLRGHILTTEDLIVRQHILNLMCRLKTEWTGAEAFLFSDEILEELKEFEKDGLLTISGKSIVVEEAGRPFVRNICMALDLRLRRNKPETRLFSLTV